MPEEACITIVEYVEAIAPCCTVEIWFGSNTGNDSVAACPWCKKQYELVINVREKTD